MSFWFWVSVLCMCFSLWIAFGKRFRPITWTTFYFNLFAAALNGASVAFHIYLWIAK